MALNLLHMHMLVVFVLDWQSGMHSQAFIAMFA